MDAPSSTATIRLDRRERGVAVLTMARPQVHNAFNEAMIGEMTDAFRRLGADQSVRAVVIRAAGKSFSAGGDLDWMRRAAGYSQAENVADADSLAALLEALNSIPKPTIAAVQGATYGGGVGLVSCCDIAVASSTATFSMSEVRLGLMPAVISPYVIAAMGQRAARRWFLTGERFDAAEALRCGLVHQVVAPEELDGAIDALLARLHEGAPEAQATAKDMIFKVAGRPIDADLRRFTTETIAAARASAAGREGISAFLEKRKPTWED